MVGAILLCDGRFGQTAGVEIVSGAFDSAPFLSQKEIADILVLDPISAHVELIEGDNVLREVIADAIIHAKLTVDRFFASSHAQNAE